uniref:Uncharacterized protein n=1 Tax=Tanacetum cinerariifolium TaxID=118510 RepID=A0A699GU87_TANCI|nr:hypothetical protein [Tanacetum cinerariifolium]
MHGHSIYRGDRVIGSPHVNDNSKPKAPWDIHPESKDPEMFSSTYELSYYHMCPGTSVSAYLFKFMKTCEEPTLMRLYELVCKAKDDLGVKPNKTKKRKANEEANDDTTPSSKKDETGSSLEA